MSEVVNYGITNENSTTVFRITPTKLDGTEEVPSTATFRVDDKITGTSIIDTTSLSLASPLIITISATDNSMVNSLKVHEIKVVTVIMTFSDNTKRTLDLEYTLRNLRFV